MDFRKWSQGLPLFGTRPCVYCGGSADTSDHTPPRCLLPAPLPHDLQVMTVPACAACNGGFSEDELRTAAIICTVSFSATDQAAVAPGGWVHAAMERDEGLRHFICARLGDDGIFQPDHTVFVTISRVMTKTVVGLLFHEFGRIVPLHEISVLAIEHAMNVNPAALTELCRRDDGGWAEVTPSGRELERQVLAVYGHEPPNMPDWRTYVPGYFEYMFIRRANSNLLVSLKIHEAITVVLECPWPSRAGPRRGGKPPR